MRIKGRLFASLAHSYKQAVTQAPLSTLNKNNFIHFIKLFLQIHKSPYLNFKPIKAIIRPKKDEK
ncbi:hypothetical protein B9N63_08770 [Campylobacter concisus]|nr:hypothetical protein B9N63_08770 [Campylobacter concisus]